MADKVKNSVVITTYNRADYLRKCLDAIAAQEIDPTTTETIIVDNNSQDQTKSIVDDFIHLHPHLMIRYLLETRQGTSFARNCGVQNAVGEYVFFTEDDAAPFPDWIKNISEQFKDPTLMCAGGPIVLDYQGQPRPLYLQGDLQGLLGGFQLPYSMPTYVYTWTEYPWGGNMAFRKSIFSEVGLFNTDMGPLGQKRLTAEETEFIHRINQSGGKIIYIPAARVRHFVPPERLQKSHLYRVALGLASSHVYLTQYSNVFMKLRWYASDLWFATRKFFVLVLVLIQRKKLWFDDYMRFWIVAQRLYIRFKIDFLQR
jgi:glucosyl-dolichyl phosphate glucuronosyltransferase